MQRDELAILPDLIRRPVATAQSPPLPGNKERSDVDGNFCLKEEVDEEPGKGCTWGITDLPVLIPE